MNTLYPSVRVVAIVLNLTEVLFAKANAVVTPLFAAIVTSVPLYLALTTL